MGEFFRQIIQDERDRYSSIRSTAIFLVLTAIGLLLATFLFVIFGEKEHAALAFDAFKYLLAPTGPVILLLTAGQAKTAITRSATVISQKTSVTVNTNPNASAAKKTTETKLPAKPPGKRKRNKNKGGREQ